MRKPTRRLSTVTIAFAVALFSACEDGGDDLVGADAPGSSPVSLSVFAPPPGASPSGQVAETGPPGPAFAIAQSDDQGNDLTIDSVKVVLREVELERARDECPDDSSGDDSNDDNDECEKFTTDIRLFEVPLDGSVSRMVTIEGVPADTYDELELEIHEPDDDEADDRQFVEDNPAFADASVRVVGSFNGESFVFDQDLNEDQEVELNPPLVVEEGGETLNVTLRLDVASWFVDTGGEAGPAGALVNPARADKDGDDSDAEGVVEDNIENSIEAFLDDDVDGDDSDDS